MSIHQALLYADAMAREVGKFLEDKIDDPYPELPPELVDSLTEGAESLTRACEAIVEYRRRAKTG